jgi:hypothetical protein
VAKVRTDPYDVLIATGQTKETSDIPKDKIAYASATDFMDRQRSDYPLRALFAAMDAVGWTVVLIGKNRWEKFVRDYPHALRIDAALVKIQAEILAGLSDADKWHLMAGFADYKIASAMAEQGIKVDDPKIMKVVGWAGDKNAKQKADTARTFASKIKDTGAVRDGNWRYHGPKYFSPVESVITSRGDTDVLYKNYPMCYNSEARHLDHQAIYINAVYAATKGNS